MRLRGEVELSLVAELGHDDVAGLVGADRDVLERHVGHLQHQPMELGIDAVDLGIESADTVAQLTHAHDQRLPLIRVLGSGDLFRAPVQLRFERLGFGDESTPSYIEGEDFVDRRLRVRLGNGLFDEIGILTDQSQVQHHAVSITYDANGSETHQNAPPWRGVIGTNQASGDG